MTIMKSGDINKETIIIGSEYLRKKYGKSY